MRSHPSRCLPIDTPTRIIRVPLNVDIEYTAKAVVGITSPMLSVATSFETQIEWHLRIASLLVEVGPATESDVVFNQSKNV